jgi:hypothetical protein
MFIVNDGIVEDVFDNRNTNYFQDYLEIPEEFKNKPSKTHRYDEKALSPTGYM